MSRAAKLQDLYTPHNPPLNWVAMGDSYTAGAGAGNPYDDVPPVENCYRTQMSYPAQMKGDFAFDTDQTLIFIACSGHTTSDDIVR
jgi:hypothetical protein